MSEKFGPYHVVDLTPGRRIWVNTLELSWPAHTIYGLLEVDVTDARKYIAEHKARTGESLSFTAFLAVCVARAVEEHKEVQACFKGRRQLVIFDDVNIGLMVEHKAGGKGALMGHVVMGANHKTFREIHDEIRSVQSAAVPSGRGMPPWFRSAMLLPWPFSRLTMALLAWNRRRDPLSFVSMGGTLAITSVGMFGGGHSGWGLTPTPQSLGLVVGGIAWKPAVRDGRIEPREFLSLTVLFDHDVVDGAPATRFTRRLVELIESGYGLDEPDER
jgi:pyruvate/2-oxoglutarate dehydrogenase complex dihydrolipoamide acyltransferase (E2) component